MYKKCLSHYYNTTQSMKYDTLPVWDMELPYLFGII